MNKTMPGFLRSIAALLAALFLLGGEPLEFGQENTFFHGYLIEKPIIRVGLGVNLGDIRISSSSGMKVYEVKTDYSLIADDVDEIFLRGYKEKLSEMYLVQISRYNNERDAELMAQDLKVRLQYQKISVSRKEKSQDDPRAGAFQVLAGDFMTRADALAFIKRLNDIGIKETWIIRKEINQKSKPLWILVNNELKSLNDDTVLYIIPSSPQSFLSFKGRDYHGIFVLQASSKGVVLVNLLNLEDYLKSVVPSELSPYSFPQLEALKAQAVAARTYAIKNMGLNENLGFDLLDTPKNQFYKGINAEHPLSTQAVEETSGETALYQGKLIDALYTSTCGGRTENVENVFQGPALPYLRSTECVYEKQEEWDLESRNTLLPVYINGQNIAREIAVLISLGIIEKTGDPVDYMTEALPDDVLSWIKKARAFLGKPEIELDLEGSRVDFLSFGRLIIDGFDWEDASENLLQESEQEYLLKDTPAVDAPSKSRLAYLMRNGVFPAPADLADPTRPLLRGEAALYLDRALEKYKTFFQSGVFKGLERNRILLENPSGDETLELSPEAFLAVKKADGRVFAKHLYLRGGEKIRWIEQNGVIRLLEVTPLPKTNILDRISSYHNWKVIRSMEQMESRINRYYPVGKIKDITALRRGESKRVIELAIDGEEEAAVVRGLRIRNVLGLRDTLFVIEREKDSSGRITHFIFRGRGWGHGVGLCQVGSYGMALAGANYKEILKKYYHGITIKKIY